ncbi:MULTISPECIES: hypothetical protein [Empedobacter]|uniref:hypothetical protein n=1 Tax=Empedobacter TaxID=59734 RepID=UPI0025778672|nr:MULTISPECIES: hypothetical protein [Empedobacter]MDM1042352.1 hypothetical protein [Empedobacter brevis]MDM1136271.1 hypothetical protein [Empedobacter sp. R750]
MKKLVYLFIFFAISVNAQIVNLKITDFSDNLPLDDADIYFKNSTKNFVSDQHGKAIIDLSNISQADELIVSKKDYQDAILKVSDLKSELNIKLEKVSELELQEAFITNLKAEDILQKVIDNYDKNFNVEQYYFLVNFQQDLLFNKNDRDFIDADLQFKFKRGDLKIKSKGIVNNEIKSGWQPNANINLSEYLKSIYLKDSYLQSFVEKLKDKSFLESDLTMTKYADSFVYEIHLKTNSTDYYLTIDKKSFAVVEFSFISYNRVKEVSPNNFLRDAKVVYKYRPHNGNWVLKETSAIWNTTYEKDDEKTDLDMNFSIIVNDYSLKPFPEFNKSVNEKMDIRRSFK